MIKQMINPRRPRVEIRMIKTSSEPRLNNEVLQSERLAQRPIFEIYICILTSSFFLSNDYFHD